MTEFDVLSFRMRLKENLSPASQEEKKPPD